MHIKLFFLNFIPYFSQDGTTYHNCHGNITLNSMNLVGFINHVNLKPTRTIRKKLWLLPDSKRHKRKER